METSHIKEGQKIIEMQYPANNFYLKISGNGKEVVKAGKLTKNKEVNVTIPSNISMVKKGSIFGDEMGTINFESSNTRIRSGAFVKEGKTNKKNIKINFIDSQYGLILSSDGENVIKGFTLKRYHDKLGISIPSFVKIIKEAAFKDDQFKRIKIPSNVKLIEKHAFANNKIEKLIIKSGDTVIEKGSFANNPLSGVRLPISTSNINKKAFDWKIENVINMFSIKNKNNEELELF